MIWVKERRRWWGLKMSYEKSLGMCMTSLKGAGERASSTGSNEKFLDFISTMTKRPLVTLA